MKSTLKQNDFLTKHPAYRKTAGASGKISVAN